MNTSLTTLDPCLDPGFDSGFRSRIASALVLSVVAHIAFGLALIGSRDGRPDRFATLSPLEPPAREEPRVRPGIERSSNVTINWLGFETPTEHVAAPAENDQAALSPLEPGLPEPVEAAAPSPTEIVVAEATRPTPSAAEPEEARPAEVPDAGAAAPSAAETPSPPILSVAEATPGWTPAPLLQIVRRSLAEAAQEAAEIQKAAAAEMAAMAAAAQAAPAPSPSPAGEIREAVRSEKESSATSREQPTDWNPGQPLAAQGLDIKAVDPRWSATTRLSAVPRNPLVRIEFGRSGAVRTAEFLAGQNTGYRDVDGPLLDAIYRWTAKGKALEELPVERSDATVSFTIRVVLIPKAGPVYRGSTGR